MPLLKDIFKRLATTKTKKAGSEPDYISSGSLQDEDVDILEEEARKERLRQLRASKGMGFGK